MDVRITPSPLTGCIPIPASKSDAHRILICAALSSEPTHIRINCLSQDIEATMECLTAMGCTIQYENGELVMIPSARDFSHSPVLNCHESGSLLRFLLPVAAALFPHFQVTGEGRLPDRPNTALMNEMKDHGCQFSSERLPYSCEGHLSPGTYQLPGNVSSQYISGLLMALPLLDADSTLELTSPLMSRNYVDMTLDTLHRFGIRIIQREGGYDIPGGQQYRSPGVLTVEGDWSNAAFWLVSGALGHPICCQGLRAESLQSDKAIISILEQAGAKVSIDQGTVQVATDKLSALTLDGQDIPDLVPILAVLLSVADGTSMIRNVGRLRIKESDRLEAICTNLTILGGQVHTVGDDLIITGQPHLTGGTVDGYHDHRIVMAMAVASVVSSEDIIITGAQSVEKSYPDFFSHFEQLGGSVHVV